MESEDEGKKKKVINTLSAKHTHTHTIDVILAISMGPNKTIFCKIQILWGI